MTTAGQLRRGGAIVPDYVPDEATWPPQGLISADEIRHEIAHLSKLVQAGSCERKAEYTRQEFAKMVGVSTSYLKKRVVYLRYGGRVRSGKILFPEKARIAAEEGRRP